MKNSVGYIAAALAILVIAALPRIAAAFPLGQGAFGSSIFGDGDGDLVQDGLDAFPTDPAEAIDADNDGFGNNSDVFPNLASEWLDSDGDGFGDNADVFPSDPAESKDSDSDGIGNNADGFPFISLGGRADNDDDGLPDVCDIECQSLGLIADADDDNDGTNDIDDAFPFDPTKSVSRGCGDPCLSVLDIDANGVVTPLSDGLVLLRYLFGLDSDALVKGALGDDAVRTDPDEIAAYIKILVEGEE